MNITKLLNVLSVKGLKLTIEYNYDYDAHLITVGIKDIEGKMLMSVRDFKYIANPSEQFMKDLRSTIEGVRRRYKEVYCNGGH